MEHKRFADRSEAGKRLATRLQRYADREDVLVLGLPRGGVPVAYEVAQAINAPLDVFVVRKLGLPGREELAMGALASGGVRILNRTTVETFGISQDVVDDVTESERQELERREALYRGDRPAPMMEGRTVILVDDGLATGSTMRAAVQALRRMGPQEIVMAVPTAPPETLFELRSYFDDVVCLLVPYEFGSVGRWYVDFDQTTDEDVRRLLEQSTHAPD